MSWIVKQVRQHARCDKEEEEEEEEEEISV
jgi:hypothetical protein